MGCTTWSGISLKNKKQFWALVAVILVCISGQLLFFNQILGTNTNQVIHNKSEVEVGGFRDADRKIVLSTFNDLSGTGDKNHSYLNEVAKYCPKCLFTENMSYYNVSDAVVFHAIKTRPQNNVTRPKNQIWVWFYLEAPTSAAAANLSKLPEHYLGQFNWTLNYRKDSDILLPYGRIFPFERPNSFSISSLEEKWSYIMSEENRNSGIYNRSIMPIPTIEELKGRKMASWIVSNCKWSSERRFIVKELSKYVKVDVYGQCGQFKCPTIGRKGLNIGIDCRTTIASKYKFYLAFENTICEDYVTEKFFRTLRTQMVPVVYGGSNYSEIAPKNSYISVTDFESVKDLADYLIFLDKNPAEYLKYFEWKKYYWVELYRLAVQFCTLCDKLWSISGNFGESKSYPDLINWWTHKRDRPGQLNGEDVCVSPRKLKIFANISRS